MLVHTADAAVEFPGVEAIVGVAGIIGERVEKEVERGFLMAVGILVVMLIFVLIFFMVVALVMVMFFVFLTAVLLVADDGLQQTISEGEGVVKDCLVVVNLLVGKGLAIGLQIAVRILVFIVKEISGLRVALALGDAGSDVVVAECEVCEAPFFVQSQQCVGGTLMELCARDVAVVFIMVRVCELLTIATVPYEAPLVAAEAEGVVDEAAVRLVFRGEAGTHAARRLNGFWMKHDDPRHGVGTVHERCRPLENLHLSHALSVEFQTMLIAPLLSFLAYAVGHADDTIVAQASDDGFRDAAACGDLVHARLFGHSIDDVAGCSLVERLLSDHRNGRC